MGHCFVMLYFEVGSPYVPRLASNLIFSFLNLLSAGVAGCVIVPSSKAFSVDGISHGIP